MKLSCIYVETFDLLPLFPHREVSLKRRTRARHARTVLGGGQNPTEGREGVGRRLGQSRRGCVALSQAHPSLVRSLALTHADTTSAMALMFVRNGSSSLEVLTHRNSI